MPPALSVMFPAFNEDARLVLRMAADFSELRLIRLPENRGKGHAVRMGVATAIGEQVLFADADGATPFHEIERLEQALREGADVVIGSRVTARDEITVAARFHRRVIERGLHALVNGTGASRSSHSRCAPSNPST